jgi:hypothetical protein
MQRVVLDVANLSYHCGQPVLQQHQREIMKQGHYIGSTNRKKAQTLMLQKNDR